jgi:hypothetical protein
MEETMSTEASLQAFGKRVSNTKALRSGFIVFRLSGADSGNYFLDCSPGEARLTEGIPDDRPLFEVIGDSEKVCTLLEGKTDARTLFLAGAFRVRGDLDYVSDLALELGLLREPM